MDSNQTTTELIQLAKLASPWAAGGFSLLGLFQLIRDLCLPGMLVKAVGSTETQEEKDALVEMFRIANQPKSKGKKRKSAGRPGS